MMGVVFGLCLGKGSGHCVCVCPYFFRESTAYS